MGTTDRAVSIVFAGDGGALLVVRRRRDGRRYCVLPGGGVEAGEDPSAAAVRELWEETGLFGRVEHHLATCDHADRRAHYYLVTVDHLEADSVELRPGTPERAKQSHGNRYRPAWIPLVHLDAEDLQPDEIRRLVREVSLRGGTRSG